jgi:hypothetical protein
MRSQRRQQSDRTDSGVDETFVVKELGERFAAYRRRSRRFARVPRELRAALVGALREGVRPSRLRRACGVSAKQLELWRLAAGAGSSGAELGRARVFSVIDAAPAPGGPPLQAAFSESEVLELHLGRWSISVRLADHQKAERG